MGSCQSNHAVSHGNRYSNTKSSLPDLVGVNDSDHTTAAFSTTTDMDISHSSQPLSRESKQELRRLSQLGDEFLFRDGDLYEALRNYQQALASLEDSQCIEAVGIYTSMGFCYSRMEREHTACEMHEKALALIKWFEPNSIQCAKCLENVGTSKRKMNRLDEALVYLKQANRKLRDLRPKSTLEAMNLGEIAKVYFNQTKYSDALTLCNEAIAIQLKREPESKEMASLNDLAGRVLYKMNRKMDAMEYFRVAVYSMQQAMPESIVCATTEMNLAKLIFELHPKDKECLPLFEHALAIHEKELPDSPRTNACFKLYAEAKSRTVSRRGQGDSGDA